jgi:SAM-dependent methyltransferase
MSYEPKLYVAADCSPRFLEQIESLFLGWGICETCLVDLMSSVIPEPLVDKKFDYVLCLDVLEHLQDDEEALRNIRRIMIATRGKWLFLRVPALQFLYGKNDEAIGHFRRYSAKTLTALLERCAFRIHKTHYQNIAGIIPWYLIGRVARRSLAVSSNEGKMFNLIVPLLRLGETIVSPPVGLSLSSICSVDHENLCFGENEQ